MGFLANKSERSLMKIKTWSQLNTQGLTLLDCPAMLRAIHYIAIFYRFDDQDNLRLLIKCPNDVEILLGSLKRIVSGVWLVKCLPV